MVDHEAVECEVLRNYPSKEFVVDRIERARRIGDLPKNCHLLPSSAILQPQNRYAR